MRYKIQLVNAFGEIVDESTHPLLAEEAIRLINAYESVLNRPTTGAQKSGLDPEEVVAKRVALQKLRRHRKHGDN